MVKNKIFKPIQILIPLIIALIVVVWLFINDAKSVDISLIDISWRSIIALIAILATIIMREFGYMWRYRILSNNDLTWRQAFKVTMLCEFSSTITPSSVGGSSLAMIFMKREGIDIGRGTAIVLITLFLDELFFVISCPIIIAFTPIRDLFSSLNNSFSSGIEVTFWSVYSIIALWTLLLYIGIFHRPHYIKNLLISIFKLPILRKWRKDIEAFGDSIVNTSRDVRQNNFKWWLKTFFATSTSWIFRYLLVNVLFWGLICTDSQWIVFARQAVVWLILIVTPTPGGSGVSEWLFTQYYADIVSTTGTALLISLIWRIFSYYLYIIAGAITIPSWLKSKKDKN
ncbi:MAG: lysylphosphatidylglycerol synthase transmembrane domain-containing protein [Muribaculaceae bacterium]|nr:lysylphosphatidylglycerol synthase transmembrane domain-containing protein [Muribaculaceae bacterium]